MNSLLAFVEVKKTLPARQAVVYEAMKRLGCASMHDAAIFLNVPLHTISGRFGELVKKGKLRIVGAEEMKGNKRSLYEIEYSNPEPGLGTAHGEATSPVFGETAGGGKGTSPNCRDLSSTTPARHIAEVK
jgi:hypothetical protein